MRLVTFFLASALAVFGAPTAVPPAGSPSRVTLEAETEHSIYLAESLNKFYLEVHLVAAATPPVAPIASLDSTVRNVALVLDRSGSMDGAPVQALRQAVSRALASLAPQDIVSVVVFGSEVETLVEAKRMDQVGNLDSVLAQIEPAGGSALYDALNQGAAQLRRFAGPTTSNHLVLLTDGPATKGPREAEDFSRLAEAFAREGITLSTIGLGPDFDEDTLAALARTGHGHFRFADKPEKLTDTFQAELAPRPTLIARDLTLTVEFSRNSEKVEPYGWIPSVAKGTTLTYQLPYLFAGQPLRILNSVTARTQTHWVNHKLATLRLAWTDLADGQPHEMVKTVSVDLDPSVEEVRLSLRPAVVRTEVNTLLTEGLQDAIIQIDKHDLRRALRALRRARNEARSFNYDLDDPEVSARIRIFDTYLSEVEARGGLSPLDRKVLRSGLFNQFDSPTADDSSDR